MNRRTLLATLVSIIVFPWKALTAPRNVPSKGYEPLLIQVFPKTLEELPGLYCKYLYDKQVFPYQIIREYDDQNDTWEGQHLCNPRRNNWWAKAVDGSTVLICTGSRFNDPETLFFKNAPKP